MTGRRVPFEVSVLFLQRANGNLPVHARCTPTRLELALDADQEEEELHDVQLEPVMQQLLVQLDCC